MSDGRVKRARCVAGDLLTEICGKRLDRFILPTVARFLVRG
jgi:hypothetical protein